MILDGNPEDHSSEARRWLLLNRRTFSSAIRRSSVSASRETKRVCRLRVRGREPVRVSSLAVGCLNPLAVVAVRAVAAAGHFFCGLGLIGDAVVTPLVVCAPLATIVLSLITVAHIAELLIG